MQIMEASTRSHLPAKTIRYYEDVGLIAPPTRNANGYRDYNQRDLQRLCFLQRARSLGFSIADCRELLFLCQDRQRFDAEVRAIAIKRLKDVERKLDGLESLRVALSALMCRCQGAEALEFSTLEHEPDADSEEW